MKRTKYNKQPDAILTSDWHLREDTPICRMDDFWSAQWSKVDFISELQRKYDCPVLHAGDLFHHWKPSPYLLSVTIEHLPAKFCTIYGQHDLPQHSMELAYKCGINTLAVAEKLIILAGCHWGQVPGDLCYLPPYMIVEKKILIWHKMVVSMGDPLKKFVEDAETAPKILRKYDQYDLIVTGDNHKSFVEEYEGHLLVNPGSLTRQTADQVDHQPSVYLWYAKTNTVERVYLPIEKDVISREHITRKEERDERIEAFISRLDGKWKVEMNFEKNLEEFEKANDVSSKVMEIVYKAIEK